MLQNVKILCVVAMSLIVAACSSGKLIKTYEGDNLANEQVAVLTAPENLSLVSVNGKKVPKYLLRSINVNYGLQPGVNVVVFEYESVWSVVPKGEDAPRSELIQSGKKEVVLNAKAGEKYNFKFDNVDNLSAAKQLADSFVADVIDSQQQVVATSTELGVYSPPVQKVNQELQAHLTSTGSSNDLPTLDGLKVLWKSASAEDKKAFLKWAFE